MSESPRYCATCGDRLSPGDNYCSSCGEAVRGATDSSTGRGGDREIARGGAGAGGQRDSGGRVGDEPAGDRNWSDTRTHADTGAGRSSTDDDRAWLRQRVADLRADGWEVTRDDGDRVRLVDRGIGSLPVHLLLFFLTSPVGNLLYGWYSWSYGAPEREVTAAGGDRLVDDGDLVGRLAPLLTGLIVGFNGLVFVGFLLAGVPSVAFGVALFTLLLTVAAAFYTTDLDTTSPGTVGRERSVETEHVRTPPESCAACGHRVLEGERRRFSDRLYLAGLPAKTYETGTNTYCADCVAESRDPDGADELEAELDRLRSETTGDATPGAHHETGADGEHHTATGGEEEHHYDAADSERHHHEPGGSATRHRETSDDGERPVEQN
ncbi:hypothetical protein RYH80_01260 [Halobaculum sp. MBLA0147]|uniref:hypothetical protein n=1 Tax=Halobaculum sp. MBLA0147 TaxID=3079934 RepID=UPI00352679B2